MPARAWVAEFDEAEAVARLLVAFRDHNGSDWPSENSFLASVERLMDDRYTEFLLGAPDDDSPPGGVCQLRYRHSVWMATEDCWLEDLYVSEDARCHGIGGALIELAVARARERGCRRVELDTNENNAGALRLYERHGFSATEKNDGDGRTLFLGLKLEAYPPDH
jgi:ribosomal protein S18 acetylase RimI-like enzyme